MTELTWIDQQWHYLKRDYDESIFDTVCEVITDSQDLIERLLASCIDGMHEEDMHIYSTEVVPSTVARSILNPSMSAREHLIEHYNKNDYPHRDALVYIVENIVKRLTGANDE